MNRMISIVIPAYNEAESLNELYDSIIEGINTCIEKRQANDYEIWFVNDGSRDDTGVVIWIKDRVCL